MMNLFNLYIYSKKYSFYNISLLCQTELAIEDEPDASPPVQSSEVIVEDDISSR